MAKSLETERPINGKQPWSWFSPKAMRRHVPDAGQQFEEVVGGDGFHSYQEWRRSATGKPTRLYALTIEQLGAISKAGEKKVKRARRKAEKLVPELDAARKAQERHHQEIEALTKDSERLKAELSQARGRIADLSQTMRLRDELILKLSQGARLNPAEIFSFLKKYDPNEH